MAYASDRLFQARRQLHNIARSEAARAGRSLPHPQFITLWRRRHPTRLASRLMTTHRLIQNFRRSQGLLWASSEFNADVLERTLLKLGVSLRRVESVSAAGLDPDRHIVFLDADQPINPAPLLLAGANLTAAPVIGIVGVEAPSRLKLLAEAGATAILRKPIQAGTVYSALFLGVNNHRRLKSAEARLAIGDRKRRGRRFLIKAVVALVQPRGLSDDDAYAELRRESMRRRLDLEEFCESLLQVDSNFPVAWPAGLAILTSHDLGGSEHAETTVVKRSDGGFDAADGGESRRADQLAR